MTFWLVGGTPFAYLVGRAAVIAKMAAHGNSSKWLMIDHHDTEDVRHLRMSRNTRRRARLILPSLRYTLMVCALAGINNPSQEANMKRLYATWLLLPFWASPNSSIYDLILHANGWTADRKAKALDPGFPREDPIAEPPIRPIRPVPTDVPVPEPRDIPVREPRDVPPPNPGLVPKPIKPLPPIPDRKPRPTP